MEVKVNLANLRAANIWPMQVNQYIQKNYIKQVTSSLIFEPSSTRYDERGLYSEDIFGQIGDPSRVEKLGYIDLQVEIVSPHFFRNICDVVPWYTGIFTGSTYAIFDPVDKLFLATDIEAEGARTGFNFFMEHVQELRYEKTASMSRSDKIDAILAAADQNALMLRQCIVCPAGWRDVRVSKTGQVEVEDINKVYLSLLSIADAFSAIADDTSVLALFDSLRYAMQLKMMEIYIHWKTFLEGKRGFAQQKYAKRGLALGTRNVITAADMISESPSSNNFLSHDATEIALFQAAKAYEPIVIHAINSLFMQIIFAPSSIQAPLIDTKTLSVSYVEVTPSDVTDALGAQSKSKLINDFENIHMRSKPVTIEAVDGKQYYLWLVYDLGDRIYLFRDKQDLSVMLISSLRTGDEPSDEYLFHISKTDLGSKFTFSPTEHDDDSIAHISVSDTVKSAIITTDHRYSEKNTSYQVYAIKRSNITNKNYIPNNVIVKQRKVFDAHVTKESWFIKPVDGVKIGTIEVRNDDTAAVSRFKPLKDVPNELKDAEGYVQAFERVYTWTERVLDVESIRPLTYVELLYIATVKAVKNKYGTVTRYPAIEVGSIYPTKVAVTTTVRSRNVRFMNQYADDEQWVDLPFYPIIGETQYVDSAILSPAKTAGLGADYDGDTITFNGLLTTEANEEADRHVNSVKYLVSPTGKFYDTASTISGKLVVHAMTYTPASVKDLLTDI